MKTSTRVRWTAGRARIAHAHVGRSPRTACGLPAIDERNGYPELWRCETCLARVEAS